MRKNKSHVYTFFIPSFEINVSKPLNSIFSPISAIYVTANETDDDAKSHFPEKSFPNDFRALGHKILQAKIRRF